MERRDGEGEKEERFKIPFYADVWSLTRKI